MTEANFAEEDYRDALFAIHHGLPRAGPGSDETTRRALALLPGLPARPRVLDLGCGPGRQSLVLAEELGVPVRAVDIYPGFLDQLRAGAALRGLADLVEPVEADMAGLDFPPASWDLIWSEGAIYLIGFEAGLKKWRPWLPPGGLAAVTECTWLRPDPPPELAEYWRAGYPDMADIGANMAAAKRAGYEVLDHFVLPEDDWRLNYYAPLAARLAELENRAGPADNPALKRVIADTRLEMALYDRYNAWYGYVFYLLRAA